MVRDWCRLLVLADQTILEGANLQVGKGRAVKICGLGRGKARQRRARLIFNVSD